jgi:hypothetical protein
MPNAFRANELSYSTQHIAVATVWSALMVGFCLAAASLSALKKIEVVGLL